MTKATLLLSLLLGLSLASPSAQGRIEPFDPFGSARVDGRPGARVPLDATFRDAQGQLVSLRSLAAGRPLVIAPVQHRCPNLCGATLEGLRLAIAGQRYRPGRDFEVVALGIDPREGPADAQVSQRRLGGGASVGGVAAVVGTGLAVRTVTDAIGYRFGWDNRIEQYAHIAAVAVLTPDGRLATWLYGVSPSPRDLHLALTDAGRGRLGSLGDQIRLLCYHYDPTTGRYSGLVMTVVRAVGLVVAAALLVLVTAFLARERARRPAR